MVGSVAAEAANFLVLLGICAPLRQICLTHKIPDRLG
jgi:hypothetical protein